jgi:hypothetical protein
LLQYALLAEFPLSPYNSSQWEPEDASGMVFGFNPKERGAPSPLRVIR